ncbi:pentatricopeptide repeat-containing protein At3g24000, mitochondrial-like [Impatiens glandulifera]|uniref:pentatricopeptide repeat-containing protein At3g24000, mitochondrial-like n=1 Tax=Impatiens glandulifera TaxID=253017 RepID=UPI001FB075E3|nr:pentatricopeptide repeat-containing protein At3g24000, mitochondrial-like [Impatiens glandulifera]
MEKSFLSSSFGHEVNSLFSTSSSALSMAKSSASNHQPQTKSYIHEPNFNPIRHFIDTLLKCNNLEQIRQVHAHITIYCMYHNLIVVNKLLYLYAYSKSLKDAHALLCVMKERDAVIWTVMIGGFAKVRDYFNCFKTFRDYIRSGLVPDNYTLPSVIRACRDNKHLRFGKLIHEITFKFGLQLDEFIVAALVDIESLVLFDSMIDEGFVLDKISMVTVVNAGAKTGDMNKARLVHVYLLWRNFSIDVILGSTIIDMYAKCGNVDYARSLQKMNHPNIVNLTQVIIENDVLGYLNLELNDVRRKQVEAVVNRLSKESKIFVVYSCDLKIAFVTVETISNICGSKVENIASICGATRISILEIDSFQDNSTLPTSWIVDVETAQLATYFLESPWTAVDWGPNAKNEGMVVISHGWLH